MILGVLAALFGSGSLLPGPGQPAAAGDGVSGAATGDAAPGDAAEGDAVTGDAATGDSRKRQGIMGSGPSVREHSLGSEGVESAEPAESVESAELVEAAKDKPGLPGSPVHPVEGATLVVTKDGSGRFRSIQAALEAASPGDTLLVKKGVYREHLFLDKTVSIVGVDWPIVDGGGTGDVITVRADGCTIRGLVVRNGGYRRDKNDSGIRLRSSFNLVEANHVKDNTFGIYLERSHENLVRKNLVEARAEIAMDSRGNGIHLWDSDGNRLLENELAGNRDGFYLSFADGNLIKDNRATDQRFGIHYMYSNSNIITGNVLAGNVVGAALMFASDNTLLENRIYDNERHGVLLLDLERNVFARNSVMGNDKGLYILNGLHNEIRENLFEGNGTGAHITAGSEQNRFLGNSFTANGDQVQYTGAFFNTWDDGGSGNYWSEYTGQDMDGDGRGDMPYWEIDLVGYLVERFPMVKVLFYSPVLEVLKLAERSLPVLRPPGVVDRFPLMKPAPGSPLPGEEDRLSRHRGTPGSTTGRESGRPSAEPSGKTSGRTKAGLGHESATDGENDGLMEHMNH